MSELTTNLTIGLLMGIFLALMWGLPIMGIIFVVLKLMSKVAWPWVLIISPFILEAVLFIFLMVIAVVSNQ